LQSIATPLGKHLEIHRWVVCDNFLPADLVRKVRIEAALFKENYEQSEIWVGKKADVGAHISVCFIINLHIINNDIIINVILIKLFFISIGTKCSW
jgi:hypothetical protein